MNQYKRLIITKLKYKEYKNEIKNYETRKKQLDLWNKKCLNL